MYTREAIKRGMLTLALISDPSVLCSLPAERPSCDTLPAANKKKIVSNSGISLLGGDRIPTPTPPLNYICLAAMLDQLTV